MTKTFTIGRRPSRIASPIMVNGITFTSKPERRTFEEKDAALIADTRAKISRRIVRVIPSRSGQNPEVEEVLVVDTKSDTSFQPADGDLRLADLLIFEEEA